MRTGRQLEAESTLDIAERTDFSMKRNFSYIPFMKASPGQSGWIKEFSHVWGAQAAVSLPEGMGGRVARST